MYIIEVDGWFIANAKLDLTFSREEAKIFPRRNYAKHFIKVTNLRDRFDKVVIRHENLKKMGKR